MGEEPRSCSPPAHPLVKLAPDTTPEQQSGARDIDRALTTFWTLVQRTRDAAEREQPIHQVEEVIFRDVLKIGLALLRAFLALSGDGDVGSTLTIPGDGPGEPPQALPRLEAPDPAPTSPSSATSPSSGSGTATTASKSHRWTPGCTCPGGSTPTCSSSGWGPSSSTTPTPRRSRDSGRSWGCRSR